MKIILVNPSVGKNMISLIPIGLLYISASLLVEGHVCEIVDLNYDSLEVLEARIKIIKPELIGISVRNIAETDDMNYIYDSIKEVVNITSRYSKVVLGGSGFSIFPKTIMSLCKADFGIVGPGETAINYLVKNLHNINRGSIIAMKDDSFIRSDISMATEYYWLKYGKYHSICNNPIPIQATRGCKYNCRYCTYANIVNHSMQQRPVELVINETRNLINITKNKKVYFVDSVLNMDLDYLKKMLRAIIDSDIICEWQGCINPIEYDMQLIELMKKSGCEFCEIGIDSFSNKQLNSLGKSFDSEQALKLVHMLEKAGIRYSVSLILGGYGETKETLFETIDIAEKNITTSINAFIGERIYPKTQLANLLNVDYEETLNSASNKSIYLSKDVLPILKEIIKNSSPKWNFIGAKIGGKNEFKDIASYGK